MFAGFNKREEGRRTIVLDLSLSLVSQIEIAAEYFWQKGTCDRTTRPFCHLKWLPLSPAAKTCRQTAEILLPEEKIN